MKKGLSILFLFILTLSEVYAYDYKIVKMNPSSIFIGNRQCKEGSMFNKNEQIKFNSYDQFIWVEDLNNPGNYCYFNKSILEAKKSKSVFDYLDAIFDISKTKRLSTRGSDKFDQIVGKKKDVGESRIALLIGNSNYKSENTLANPIPDVQLMSEKLSSLGFNVYLLYDADKTTIDNGVKLFSEYAKSYNSALIYYAGHGQQYNEDTYLVPVDAVIETNYDIVNSCVPTKRIVSFMNDVENLQNRFLIIDACRSSQNLLAQRGSNNIDYLKTDELIEGIVLFSTQKGHTAQDYSFMNLANSPFATALAKHISNPNQTVVDMIVDVIADVQKSTKYGARVQKPRYESTISHKFYFNPVNRSTSAPLNSTSKYLSSTNSRYTRKTVTEEKGTYDGDFLGNVKDGYGTYTWKDGEKYVGEWKNGKMEGQGTYYYKSGNKYVGEWKNGKMEGQGTCYYKSGSKYVGEYRNGKMEGQGTYTWKDGDKYVGEYRNDKREGQGTYTRKDGSKYVGEYRNDKREGQGTYTWKDGNKYVGEWKNDKREGQGKMVRPDGSEYNYGQWHLDKFYPENTPVTQTPSQKTSDNNTTQSIVYVKRTQGEKRYDTGTYVGDFLGNVKDGYGTYTWKDGNKYEGEWKNGKMEGQGTYTWKDGEKYEGEWVNNKKEGQGTYYYKSGNKYEGEWVNDTKEGQGTYTWKDGEKYEGEWKNGNMEGQGTYYYKSGNKYVGEWKNGKREGQGKMVRPDGTIYKAGQWHLDEFVK